MPESPTMKRFYFLSSNLDELASVERELEGAGITTPQLHVLSLDDAGVEQRGMHGVEAVLKKDVVRGTELGAVIGLVGGGAVLAVAYYTGLTEAYTWVPAVFLAVIILGFCTWEGGLIGIQEPHVEFRQFEDELKSGQHLLFVDIDPEQESVLQSTMDQYPHIQPAGQGAATPRFVVRGQDSFNRFMKTAP